MRNRFRHIWNRCKEECDVLQSREEFIAFLVLISEVPHRVIDIGFYRGAMSRAFLELGATEVVAIDIQDHWDRNPDAYQYAQNLEDEFGHKFTIITGDSSSLETLNQVKEKFEKYADGCADIVFIDGNHSEVGVIRDYLSYKQLVREGGLIVFHDIYMDSVAKAWEQITSQNNWATLELCQKKGFYGIGILFKGVEALPLPDPSDMTYKVGD